MTRFNTIHPYPAMIADHLATDICEEYVKPDNRVLDPFCGTGRTLLAASELGAYCVGIDVNPLASIIVNAKAGMVNPDFILKFLYKIDHAKNFNSYYSDYELEPGRKVEWFSEKVRGELRSIIAWLNRKNLTRHELFLIASILSATVREVSNCRKGRWKLHRLSLQERKRVHKSPWEVFKHRLRLVHKELCENDPLKGICYATVGDSRNLSYHLKCLKEHDLFDVVITSPPYGDSHTTVQYGAMSGLSLGVLRHLKDLEIDNYKGSNIDRFCLGGKANLQYQEHYKESSFFSMRKYWFGGLNNISYQRVSMFLIDIEMCCKEICKLLKNGGRAIFIVARRSTGGWRLYLDHFLIDIMSKYGLSLERTIQRKIKQKNIPLVINRYGRRVGSYSNSKCHVPTMRIEYILVFKKTRKAVQPTKIKGRFI